MAVELVLYTNPMSRGRIARWMLEETGAPYRAEVIAYGEAMKSPAYRALNPMGKVPTLQHGATIVTECAAICAYLADAFPEAGLAPSISDPLRGSYLRWMFFAAGPVEHATTNHALGVVPPADRQGMVGYGTLALVVETLEQALGGGPFFLGERFSAVDVYLGAQLGWGLQFGTIPARPALQAYVERLNARPAAQRARAADDVLTAASA